MLRVGPQLALRQGDDKKRSERHELGLLFPRIEGARFVPAGKARCPGGLKGLHALKKRTANRGNGKAGKRFRSRRDSVRFARSAVEIVTHLLEIFPRLALLRGIAQ